MKKLLIIALFTPLLSFAQKFEVSEMGGYSRDLHNNFFQKSSGFSNQVSVGYFFTKHFSLGAYHELTQSGPNSNAFGLQADAHFKFFYFGVAVAEMFFGTKTFAVYPDLYFGSYPGTEYFNYRINPATSYGAHIGMNQKLSKHFSTKEQIGYSCANSTGAVFGGYRHDAVRVPCESAFAGIAWRF